MVIPSAEIILLLSVFRQATTRPVFERMVTLVCGAIVAPGVRTVAATLSAMGLSDVSDFGAYHRVLNRAKWSPLVMSRLLLGLILAAFALRGEPLMLLIDDTLERRRGKKVRYRCYLRDAVLSSANRITMSYGIRWLVVCVLVRTPWNERPWALPFLLVPTLSERRCQQLKRPHHAPAEWAARLLTRVHRWCQQWQPGMQMVVVADGGFACTKLVRSLQQLTPAVTLVCRLRLDASLYGEPDPSERRPDGQRKRGRKPKKGRRLPNLQDVLVDPGTGWRRLKVPWYGQEPREVEMASGTALWHRNGTEPVPVRWVLLRCPEGAPDPFKPTGLFCSHPSVAPEQILAWYTLRWNIEVTFEEMRACMGLQTQRHWATRAIGRGTPCLFAVFTIVVLLAKRLYPDGLPVQQSAWYAKEQATYRDVLAAVREHLWGVSNCRYSPQHPGHCLIPIDLLRTLIRISAHAS